ncbi:conserved protein of unknown function (plasmid) [Rhodovastum atsumiense]|uniref:Phage tail protein n=1 Tax=Rhodovastum atsumiense TaxID=504468 RepID=A0A5M6IN22_9PROT|nr:hypothetical protein [Rhodovastum atsumiense]KAA5609654.1 hypothetical protein F1189_23105 [Rhodovastum atsumiense]CAH2606521.1 conserved protein of unknown function [Rhodovastum atsumiense]
MPIVNTGVGDFNVGRDCTIVMVGPFGRVDLPNITGFDARPGYAQVHVDRLDGTQLHAALPKGWNGSIDLERAGPSVDDLMALIELGWFTTGRVSNGSIYQYIQEPDGSQSTYQFDNVSFWMEDSGRWQGDTSVKQRLAFSANRRRKV